jgi:ribosomal-protein-alanine N-acetyltransferase
MAIAPGHSGWPRELATRRLRLRPATDGDAPVLERQWNDPAVGRYLWDARPVARGTVMQVLRASHRSFRLTGYGLWAVSRDGLVVGCCGLRPSPHVQGVELLYSLERATWGRGYAAEAAGAVLAFARLRLGLARVVAAANPDNIASWRVLERLAMRRVGRASTPIEDLLLYST